MKVKHTPNLPMPLYDDINEIQGEIMNWVESYVENYPQEQGKEKEELIYKSIANFCKELADGGCGDIDGLYAEERKAKEG